MYNVFTRHVSGLSLTTFIIDGLIHTRFPGEAGSDDDDDVITSATRRRRRKTGSDTASAATEATKPQAENPSDALENGRKPSEIISLPGIVPTSARAPSRNSTSEGESSEMNQQSRPSVQIKLLDKPGTLIPNSVKRKRLEPDMADEAVKEAKQTVSATGLSSTQSHHSSKHRCLEPNTSTEAAITKAVQTVGAIQPLPTQLHQSPKHGYLRSSTPPKSESATEATESANAAEPSSTQPLQSPKHRHVKSDTSTEAASEAKHTINRAGSSSAQSHPTPEPPEIPNPNAQFSSTHATPKPSIPEMSMSTKKQNNTTLWISIPSSTDAVPMTLRSCMTMSSLFHSVFKICGLAEGLQQQQQQHDKVLGLRTTLEWTHDVGGIKKYLMLKRDFEDSFDVFLRIINALPCWEQEGGCCSVAIEVVMLA